MATGQRTVNSQVARSNRDWRPPTRDPERKQQPIQEWIFFTTVPAIGSTAALQRFSDR